MANVSKATVSAVLNNKPTVSPQTRELVNEVIRHLNYRPNEIARSLSIRRTKCIGLVIKEIDNPYFAKVMKGVFDVCCEMGYTVLLGSSELSPNQELKSVQTLTHRHVDGLIISPLQGDDIDFSYLGNLLRENYPLVMLGSVKNYITNTVDIDNVKAAYEAVSYLIKLGHTSIAYFSGPAHSAHSQDRLEGYRQAMIDHQLPLQKSYILEVGSYIANSYQVGKRFFSERGDWPTAVFCYNDLVALGLINALTELDMNVPEQVSVIGFDNIEFCEAARVPLTTVLVPAYDIGCTAARLLLRQIAAPKSLNEKIVLETKLIVRKSCAPKIEHN